MPIAPAAKINRIYIYKSSLEGWYDNEIKENIRLFRIGSTGIVDDSVTIEERIKEQLDNRIWMKNIVLKQQQQETSHRKSLVCPLT